MAQKLCENCNGQGLVSTGTDKLNLRVGSKVICRVCNGSGKVDLDVVTEKAPVPESPKAQDPSQSGPSGEGSSDSDSEATFVPKVGDRCLTAEDKPGTLGKNEAGDWVCNPDAE